MNDLKSLHIGKATDIENPKERKLYRLLEMVQGGVAWLSLFLVFIFSIIYPPIVFYILLVFIVFTFILGVYYTVHLFISFKILKKHLKEDWIGKVKKIDNWERIYHLIVLPNYKEPFEIIAEGLQSFIDSDYPTDKMIIVLAFEERAGEERRVVAQKLENQYGDKFFKLISTFHPDGIVGEMKGKGANDAWGSKKAKELIVDPLNIPYEDIIYSSFDSDTQVYSKYFSCVTYHYLTAEKPTKTSYQPTPFYNNNIWDAPWFSKTSSLTTSIWYIICQERPDALITYSSHSMSFKALVDVGFKQNNMISEDSRIFWQCFFRYDGDYRTQPLYYPLSMDSNVGRNIFESFKNVYLQRKRWGYPENTPYFIYHSLKNKKVPLKKKLWLGIELVFGRWNWAVGSILVFILGWLPVTFAQGGWFSGSLLSYTVPKLASQIMTVAMFGLIGSVWVSITILPSYPREKGLLKYLIFLFSWFLVPFQMLVLSSIPALDAQTRYMLGKYMGFWVTPKQR